MNACCIVKLNSVSIHLAPAWESPHYCLTLDCEGNATGVMQKWMYGCTAKNTTLWRPILFDALNSEIETILFDCEAHLSRYPKCA